MSPQLGKGTQTSSCSNGSHCISWRSSSHRVVASQAQIFNLTTWPLQNRPIKSISISSGRMRSGGATTPPSMTKNKTKGKQRKKHQNNNNTNNNNNLVVALESTRVEFPSLVSNKESEHVLCPKRRTDPIVPN